MKTGIIYHGEFPWNRGVGRLAKTLHSIGIDVHILTKKSNNREYSFAQIHTFPYGKGKIKKILSMHLPINFLWTEWLKRKIRELKISLLIVREIPLAASAIKAGKKYSIPVILDMRENYPAAVKAWGLNKPIHFITHNAFFVKIYEKWVLRKINHVLVVVGEQKKRLINIGVPENKISVNMNTPESDFIHTAQKIVSSKRATNNIPTVIYIGFVKRHRGIDEIIDAFHIIKNKGKRAKFIIVGKGNYLFHISEKIKRLTLDNSVEIVDFLPPEKVPEIIYKSDIGIINHLKSEHTETTIPNKLFEYMALKLPVIASDVSPIRTVFNEVKCGILVDPSNPSEIADAVIELAENPGKRAEMGNNGYRSVLEKFNWEIQSQKMISAIKSYLE